MFPHANALLTVGTGGTGGVVVGGAMAYKSSSSTALSGTPTAVAFNSESYDVGNWHSTLSNTSRLTFPSGTGLVRLASNLNVSDEVLAEHRLNGSVFRGMGKADADSTVSSSVSANLFSAPIAVLAGDYLEVYASGSGSINSDSQTRNWHGVEVLNPALKYALVYRSTGQAIAAGTNAILNWDSEVADTNGFHDNVTSNSRLTVPSGVSLVRVSANVSSGNVAGQHVINILKNGAIARGLPFKDTDTTDEDHVNVVSAPIEVTPGDYFQVNAFHTAATTIGAGEADWFAIEEVAAGIKRALVYKTGSQTLGTTSYIALTWDAEVYDTDAMHDNVTNNSRLTVPAGCTEARVSTSLKLSSATLDHSVRITKNGATYPGMPAYSCDTGGTDNLSVISGWIPVTAGDYFECEVHNYSGGNTVGTDNETWFCLECR